MEQNNSKKSAHKFLGYVKNPLYIFGVFLLLAIIFIGIFWFFTHKKNVTSTKTDSIIETMISSAKPVNLKFDGQNSSKNGREDDMTIAINGLEISAAYESCINNTKNNPQCKDCCDCLSDSDSTTITSCRNICATHDFSTNTNFITVNAPSILGEKGDYSTCTNQASSDECKTCCESAIGLQCGDYRFCRTACNITFDVKNDLR